MSPLPSLLPHVCFPTLRDLTFSCLLALVCAQGKALNKCEFSFSDLHKPLLWFKPWIRKLKGAQSFGTTVMLITSIIAAVIN